MQTINHIRSLPNFSYFFLDIAEELIYVHVQIRVADTWLVQVLRRVRGRSTEAGYPLRGQRHRQSNGQIMNYSSEVLSSVFFFSPKAQIMNRKIAITFHYAKVHLVI